MGFVVNKMAFWKIYLGTSVSVANYQPTNCFTINIFIYTDWYYRSKADRSTKRAQSHLDPKSGTGMWNCVKLLAW
jgi:hypothetical protein